MIAVMDFVISSTHKAQALHISETKIRTVDWILIQTVTVFLKWPLSFRLLFYGRLPPPRCVEQQNTFCRNSQISHRSYKTTLWIMGKPESGSVDTVMGWGFSASCGYT
jgi:hypothetical protein